MDNPTFGADYLETGTGELHRHGGGMTVPVPPRGCFYSWKGQLVCSQAMT